MKIDTEDYAQADTGFEELKNTIHKYHYDGHTIKEQIVAGTESAYVRTFALDNDAQSRKQQPVFTGVVKYFPNALRYVSHVSFVANEQHNPGTEVHWDRNKSQDELDALMRHLCDHSINELDDDGLLHMGKIAWRALAKLEKMLENK